MSNDASLMRPIALRLARAMCIALALGASSAWAQDIDVSLNVFYADPSNAGSGGTWELVAKSGGSGLASLRVPLRNVSSATVEAPRGMVNGTNVAGFGIFSDTFGLGGFRDILIGQAPLNDPVSPPAEQTVFYGVGTLTNGAPNYPGKPPGANSLGPTFSSLTGVQDVPWATGDAFMDSAWNSAVRFVSGTFAEGVSPGFFASGEERTRGNLFTSVGSSTDAGDISPYIVASTIVRSNFTGSALPDYNGNGEVDAADYVLWRKTEGQTGAGLAADGDGDLDVDGDDYLLWRANFGATVPGAGASLSTSSVPEPASGVLLAFGAILLASRRGTTSPARPGWEPTKAHGGRRRTPQNGPSR